MFKNCGSILHEGKEICLLFHKQFLQDNQNTSLSVVFKNKFVILISMIKIIILYNSIRIKQTNDFF